MTVAIKARGDTTVMHNNGKVSLLFAPLLGMCVFCVQFVQFIELTLTMATNKRWSVLFCYAVTNRLMGGKQISLVVIIIVGLYICAMMRMRMPNAPGRNCGCGFFCV